MEITTNLKLELTFVERGKESGTLPLGVSDERDLRETLKMALGADDVQIKSVKRFENDEENEDRLV